MTNGSGFIFKIKAIVLDYPDQTRKLFANNKELKLYKNEIDFLVQSEENDSLARKTRILAEMTSSNYGLLIKIYPFCNYDDKLFSIYC